MCIFLILVTLLHKSDIWYTYIVYDLWYNTYHIYKACAFLGASSVYDTRKRRHPRVVPPPSKKNVAIRLFRLIKGNIRVWHLVSKLLGIETFLNFWEYRSRSQKFWSRKKVSVLVSKILSLEKSLSIGLENIWSRKKVSVSVSKIFSLEKKSQYRSRKYLVSKKSLGLGLENFGLEKKSRYRSRWNFWSRHSVDTARED